MRTPEKVDVKGKDEIQPLGDRDLVFSSGVLHHIAVNERAKWMSVLAGSLRPGGMCAIWENNLWSLPTRFIFPRFFAAMRPAERYWRRLPIGAQYVVLSRSAGC